MTQTFENSLPFGPSIWTFIQRGHLQRPPDMANLNLVKFPYDLEFVGEGEIAGQPGREVGRRRRLGQSREGRLSSPEPSRRSFEDAGQRGRQFGDVPPAADPGQRASGEARKRRPGPAAAGVLAGVGAGQHPGPPGWNPPASGRRGARAGASGSVATG